MRNLSARVIDEVGKVVVGRERETKLLLVSFLAGGHALLEGVPGIAKTLLAKTFSKCLGLEFRRVQFTPDMMPLDVVGGFIFNMKTREFDLRKGPIFTNIMLADEINRAPPKVQSALLEGMQERQVTLEGHSEPLPSPFMVVATQNPLEFQGVYPLPEGQLDRFTMRIVFGYPDGQVESDVIRRNLTSIDLSSVKAVLESGELPKIFEEVNSTKVSDSVVEYLSELARASRTDERVYLGASPRALVHLVQCARASAYIEGRSYVTPDDVKSLAVAVLAHRIHLNQSAILKGSAVDTEKVVGEIIERVTPPR